VIIVESVLHHNTRW